MHMDVVCRRKVPIGFLPLIVIIVPKFVCHDHLDCHFHDHHLFVMIIIVLIVIVGWWKQPTAHFLPLVTTNTPGILTHQST